MSNFFFDETVLVVFQYWHTFLDFGLIVSGIPNTDEVSLTVLLAVLNRICVDGLIHSIIRFDK